MSTQMVLTDMTEAQADEVVSDFESEGCTAKKEKQPDGLFTVRATCPDA